jgi:prolyl oligopeptidase
MSSSVCAVVVSVSVTAGVAACSASEPSSRQRYPATRTVDVVDDYHGTRVADPYRWLEALDSAEVRQWAAAQTAIAEPILRNHEHRPWLRSRMEEYAKYWDAFTEPSKAPDVIDPKTIAPGKRVTDTWVSPDRKFAAYAVSEQGSEWVETRVRRLSDGKDLDEKLEGMLWSDAWWTKDSRGFFYIRSIRPSINERTALKSPAVYYHVPGTSQSDDAPVFRTPAGATDLVLEVDLSQDGRYLFVSEGNGAHVDGIGWVLTRLHVLDLGNPLRPSLTRPLQSITPERDASYQVIASAGDTLYVFTDRNAPRRRLVAIDLRNPAPERWRDVIPQPAGADEILDTVHDIGGRFVVVAMRNVQHSVRVFDRAGRLIRELSIPPMTSVRPVEAGSGPSHLSVEAMQFFSPPTRKRYSLATGAEMGAQAQTVPPGLADYEAKQVWYRSRDGVRVPMFLLHRRGLALDGSHPVFLTGYGASGQSTRIEFAEHTLAALDLGMIVAMPALRGGGEFGRAWYDAAILERKQTTFDDFIAAAEYLIKERYTSPSMLAIEGASNGGLLITAVITQRPDLFRVAVAGVPMADAIRYDRGRHRPQFGWASNPAHFPFLYAYSPQHRIKPGTCYPATLIATALNDDRAPAWMALKFTATLQAAQSCDRPVILRADTGGGHQGDFMEDAADTLAFVAGQLGLKIPAKTAAR